MMEKLNLQSPRLRTRSTKENAIDADLRVISDALEEVSMGVFVDGTYEREYSEPATGEVISLRSFRSTEIVSAAAGTYTLSQRNGDITTDGSGDGLELSIVVREDEGVFDIDFESSAILNGGLGFNYLDILYVNSTSIGGSDEEEVIEITIGRGDTNQGYDRYAGISVDAETGVILYGGLFIDPSSLPTQDPEMNGAVWIDTENGNVLRISIVAQSRPKP